MEKFGTRFISLFIGIGIGVSAIIICAISVTFFTSNLISATLKVLIYNNIKDFLPTQDALLISFISSAIFSLGIAFTFESSAFWLELQKEKNKSIGFAIVSGYLSSLGMLKNYTMPALDVFSFNDFCNVNVLIVLGFAPPITIIVITKVISYKLDMKTETGETLYDIFKKDFQEKIISYFKKDTAPEPKANRFEVLLGGLAPNENEPINTTYKRKYANGTI